MKFFSFILILIGFLLINHPAEAKKNKRILMIIASQNFRDEELLIPKKLFEEAGYKVIIASSSLKPAKGMLGTIVIPQLLIDQVNVKNYDAIIFVGGIGAQEYFYNPVAHKIAKEAVKEGKILGAICLAPRILAEAGVLKGKKATVWPSEAKFLEEKGAIYTGNPVQVDRKIVTGAGPFAAKEFAEAILKLLKNKI